MLKSLERVVNKLVAESKADYYNPYTLFAWPERLPEEGFWMPENLLSLYGTEAYEGLSQSGRWLLSKWEAVNLFSVQLDGEIDFIDFANEVLRDPYFAAVSDYFYFFVREENAHMFVFNEFCKRYAGRRYRIKRVASDTSFTPQLRRFVSMCDLLIGELILDDFNVRIAADQSMFGIVREINDRHHRDESRHIAMAKSVVREMWNSMKADLGADDRKALSQYLYKLFWFSVAKLHNPDVYRDAGLIDGYALRRRSLEARRAHYLAIADRRLGLFVDGGLFDPSVGATEGTTR